MAKLTPNETFILNTICINILNDPHMCASICSEFTIDNCSFEFLFNINRMRNSASLRSLVKTIKEIRIELQPHKTAAKGRSVGIFDNFDYVDVPF